MRFEDVVARVRAASEQVNPAPTALASWRSGFRVDADSFVTALDAGLAAGQLAFCFAGGYQAALRRLLPSLPADAFAALLVTEGKKQRPEELVTTLRALGDGRFRLDGEKSWVAGGTAATHLLVLARHVDAVGGRVSSSLALVTPEQGGLVLESRPASGFLDAVPHARARFDNLLVTPDMLLPGDGWRDYARPFRTIEDIHVSTTIAAHLVVHALRRDFPPALVATLLAVLSRLGQCADRDARDPHTHLLLAGAEQELAAVAAQVTQLVKAADDPFARDWRTNGMLLALAAPARVKRLEKAMALLRS